MVEYSLGEGVVVENAIYGQEGKVLVAPFEQLPNMRGRIEINPQEYTVHGVNANGKAYSSRVKVTSAVTAIYWNEEGNRLTAPQMQQGERVMLYRLGGEEAIYFKPLNRDANKRVQETVIMGYAAKPVKDAKEGTKLDQDNTYTQTFDGVNGMIETRTTQANEEKAGWTQQFNGRDGIMVIKDEKGNIIQIDSVNDVITIVNRFQTAIQLDKDTINIGANKDINVTATNNFNLKAQNINFECDEFNLKASNVKWAVGSEITMDCPTINLNGMVNMGGFTTTGAGGGGGSGSVKGNIDVQGSTSVQGSLSVQGSVHFASGGTSGGVIAGSYIDT